MRGLGVIALTAVVGWVDFSNGAPYDLAPGRCRRR